MMTERASRWVRRKAKHRKDHNHIPGGFQAGNARYHRANPVGPGNVTMGKARGSWL